MATFRYTVPVCESEWESRSLAELVAVLIHRYRRPTRQRIEAIASVLPRILSSNPQPREAYGRVANVFRSLGELIDTHERLEDRILCPALVRMEHDPASTNQSVREALCQKIAADVKADHNLLRRESVALRHAVIEIKGSSVSIDEAVLALNLDMLVLLLNERLDLEDRYLWPRALVLLQREL
jgi:iron-sulfur cluster repair protein YtfE (RIC family)